MMDSLILVARSPSKKQIKIQILNQSLGTMINYQLKWELQELVLMKLMTLNINLSQ